MTDFLASFAAFIQRIIEAIRSLVGNIRDFNDSQGELAGLMDE